MATHYTTASSSNSGSYIHEALSRDVRKVAAEVAGVEPISNPDEFVDTFLKSHVEKKKVDSGLLGELRNQVFVMTNAKRGKRPVHQKPSRNKITAKMKRKLKLFVIPKEEQKYHLYEPIHQLWKGYIRDLLRNASNLSAMNVKLTKADYHGCFLTVAQSKCPSYVGISGIVVQETLNTLQVVCKDDKLRSVPKAGSIFTFSLDGIEFKLYGNHIRFRPSERSARKFKDKSTIEL